MKPTQAIVSIASLIASGSLGVDAMVFDDTVLVPKEDIIANERVEVKQIENIVEAKAPWKGEQGITVKYDMGEPTFTERIKDERKKAVFFEAKENGFEYGLILNEKPDTNTFCSTIENAEQYDWFKQLPLTEEEINKGVFSPENVVNSYAVYHKELKNHVVGQTNYETGKAFHRYRPQAVDANGNSVWGDSNYVDGQICDTIPQEWLDTAVYPVKI